MAASRGQAANQFQRARRQAEIRDLWSDLTGTANDLIPFEDLSRHLGVVSRSYGGMQSVRLDRIIGSVDRYADFDRAFLPKKNMSRGKWLGVYQARERGVELPPVSLYKVGDAYFVVDGHHRVSVGRQEGQVFIDAEVIEVQTKVPVTEDLRLEDLEILGEQSVFLERTHLDELRPEHDTRFSVPGSHTILLEHISVHRYFMGQERGSDVSWEEAVVHWYDHVYTPVVEAIRSKKIQEDFPGRTEADLYIWIMEHAHLLREKLHGDVSISRAVSSFADGYSPRLQRVLRRARLRMLESIVPDELQDGPPAGIWRRDHATEPVSGPLFKTILCPVTGSQAGWKALEQAAEIARREGGRLVGVLVLPEETGDGYADEQARAILNEFATRCDEQTVPHVESVERGDPSEVIVERGRWTDLIAIPRQQTDDHWPFLRLGSIFQTVVQRSIVPVLSAPVQVTPMRRVLVPYDGSPKAHEALFVACHLSSAWGAAIILLTAREVRGADQVLESAQRYLARCGVNQAQSVLADDSTEAAILAAAADHSCDLITMGGYGLGPLLKAFLGSTVDRILRVTPLPVMICR